MLCQACESIFSGIDKITSAFEDDWKAETHHATALTFRRSVSKGCYICVSLWARFSDDLKGVDLSTLKSAEGEAFLTWNLSRRDEPMGPYTLENLSLFFSLNTDCTLPRHDTFANFMIQPLRELEGEKVKLNGNMTTYSTGDEESWAMVKKWMHTCATNHIKCRNPKSPLAWCPTRLLDIGTSQSSQIRLCITDKDSIFGPYVTLSHCWGANPIVKLLVENIDDMEEKIQMSALPLTFKEAIQVTRKLGFHYLWIDALCIIQDSIEDWLREASTMGDVYSHGACNIAATNSLDGTYGLFASRDPSLVVPSTIRSTWEDHTNDDYVILEEKFWESRVQQAPLNRRGWVVQERFLSPRVLHFGKDQLLWECSEMDACEAFPRGLPGSFEQYGAHFKGKHRSSKNGNNTQHNHEVAKLKAYNLSESLLETYSKCQLSKEEDKLVAFSGLAKYLEQLVGDEYVAGLWRSHFVSQLLWNVRDQQQEHGIPSCRPAKYRAPSWSWAAVDGSIVLGGFYPGSELIEVVECVVEAAGNDPTAKITKAFLRVRGTLCPVSLLTDRHTHAPVECTAFVGSKELDMILDLDIPPKTHRVETLFLPVHRKVWDEVPWLQGLVLKPDDNEIRGAYSRVGVFKVSGQSSCNALCGSSPERAVLLIY